MNAELGPGLEPGEGTLRVEVRESEQFLGTLRVANDRSPAVNGERASFDLTARNLTGWGDQTTVSVGGTEGLTDVAVTSSLPLTRRDTMLSFYAEFSESDILEEPLNVLDIESESETYEMTLSHPFSCCSLASATT